MLKSMTAVMAAAVAAAVFTVASMPNAQVNAGPLPAAVSAPINACADRPWPYTNCVGTQFGSRNVRLITTDRLAQAQ